MIPTTSCPKTHNNMTTITTTTTTVADTAGITSVRPLPIILFIDKSYTDLFGSLATTPLRNMFPNHLDIADNPNPQEPVTAELPHKHYVKSPGSHTNFRMSHFIDRSTFHRAHLNLIYHQQVHYNDVQNRHGEVTYLLPSNNANPQELEGEDDQSEMEEVD